MKVHNHALEAYALGTAVRKTAPATAATAQPARSTANAPTEAALVSVSTEARALAASMAEVVDTEKVAALRERVQAGSFQVDAKMIAQRLLDELA